MAKSDATAVEILAPDDVPEVVSVLSESFFDYPVMRFVLGAEADYPERLDTLIGFFVMARVLRDEVMLGVRAPSGLTAAALVSYPSRGPSPAELGTVRERTWADLGADARARYERFGAATDPFEAVEDHIHLGMIGVRRSAQGQGLGRTVLEAVHQLSASDPSSAGVSLTTEVDRNVSLYQHFGYEVVGSARIESAVTTWGMYRSDQAPR
jgi:ribosomal protein S18 acetylase RimI-like enzyme